MNKIPYAGKEDIRPARNRSSFASKILDEDRRPFGLLRRPKNPVADIMAASCQPAVGNDPNSIGAEK